MEVLGWGLLSWVGFDALVVLALWLRGPIGVAHQQAVLRQHWHRWSSHRNRRITAPLC